MLGRAEFVSVALESELFDPLLADGDGCTSLHNAICSNNSRCIELLLDYTAKRKPNMVETLLNKKDTLGFTPLHLTCYLGRHNCLEFLLCFVPPTATTTTLLSSSPGPISSKVPVAQTEDKGSSPNRLEEDDKETNGTEKVSFEPPEWQQRIKAQLDLEALDNDGMTCLHWAVTYVLRYLVMLVSLLSSKPEMDTTAS